MSGKSVHANTKKIRKETPMVVWLWMMGLGIVSYMVARFACILLHIHIIGLPEPQAL